jgi:hypothetical protein
MEMARGLWLSLLVAGAAAAQEAPMTAADAAARSRGETIASVDGGTPAGTPAAAFPPSTTVTNPNAATKPADATAPRGSQVQGAQDRCPPGDADCAKKLREPAPQTEAPPASIDWTKESPSQSAANGLFGSELVGLGSPAINAPGGLAGAAAVPSHALELSAYFILNGQWVQQDPTYLYVGKNNGFSLADARIEVTGRPTENLWLFLSVDGAVANRSATDPSQGSRGVALKDAYGVYSPGYHLRIEAGQFKAPQDVEHLLEETEIKFPTRSLLTDGLHNPAGYETNGLSLDRQIGIALGTDVIALPFGSIAAQVAITNGNGPNTLFNSTSMPGVIGRIAIGILGIVSIGGDAYFMPQATGTQPDLFRDDWTGAGADIRVEWKGIHLMGLLQYRDTQHLTAGGPDEHAFGFTIEGAYRLPGKLGFLEPAIRYASLDPSDLVVDQQLNHTLKVQALDVALNIYAPGTSAARLSVAYVHRTEDPSRTLTNDGLDLSLQVRF